MNGIAAAFSATALYYVGFAVFKLAADRMAPLRGNRIFHMIWTILGNWVFLIALTLVLCGLTLQIVALRELPLSTAVPIFMSGIIPLLVISMAFFGERLTAREWLSLLLIGAAILLLTASVSGQEPIGAVDVPLWKIGVVVGPAVLVPVIVLVLGDHRPDGRHARPITGIAYGLSSGFCVGTAELAIKGWSDDPHATSLRIVTTPWPYLTVVAAGIGFGIMVLAFQRCRVSIVSTVMTVSAKSYLLTMGTFMYAEPWPRDMANSALRLAALVFGAIAVLQFPRHRPVHDVPEEREHGPGHEEVPPAQDPFGNRHATGPVLGDPRFTDPQPILGAPPMPPPPPGPYAQDPLGRGPYNRPPGAAPPPRPPNAHPPRRPEDFRPPRRER